jgi:hypothetical protein
MQIKDLFSRDLFRPINGVVKADQHDEAIVWQELDEYVVNSVFMVSPHQDSVSPFLIIRIHILPIRSDLLHDATQMRAPGFDRIFLVIVSGLNLPELRVQGVVNFHPVLFGQFNHISPPSNQIERFHVFIADPLAIPGSELQLDEIHQRVPIRKVPDHGGVVRIFFSVHLPLCNTPVRGRGRS